VPKASRWQDAVLMEWLEFFVIENDGHCILVNDLKQGKEYKKRTNGWLYENNYLDNKYHGTLFVWRKNGSIWSKSNYIYGKKEGFLHTWHENGQIWYEENYINNVSHGMNFEWMENGSLLWTSDHADAEDHINE
jgi:antitoxin component YwqK of YwqJK toxin-antitoxin module